GRVTDAEAPHRIGGQAACFDILPRMHMLRELLFKPAAGRFNDMQLRFLTLGAHSVFTRQLRQRDADIARQALYRFGVSEPFMAHDKTDSVAVCGAAEAMEKSFVVVYGKGRRLFIMEGAQPLK